MTTDARQIGSLEQAILSGVNQATVNLHTALPGVVKAFYAAEQEADVQIGIPRIMKPLTGGDGQERIEAVPMLLRAPVWIPRGGGFSVNFPIQAGDEVLVVFAERDLSQWLDAADPTLPPASRRRHDFSDAIILPGLTSAGNRLATYSTSKLQIRSDDDAQVIEVGGGEIRVTASAVRLGSAAEDLVALVSDLIAALEADVDTGGDTLGAGTLATLATIRGKVDGFKT